MKPDMEKVKSALSRYGKIPKPRDWRTYPPPPSPPAQDAAIRKPLKAHGDVCCGFTHYHFLNRE